MIKNQLLFALRRLGRDKLTTSINVLGLTFGILSCLVIYLYVSFEFSYDKFHADRDRIYRLMVSTNQGSDVWMAEPVGSALRQEATAFSAVTTLYTDDTKVLIPITGQPPRVIPGISSNQLYHITFADTDYLKIFHYEWLAGNPATALQQPFSVVLTESEAKYYFQGGKPQDWMGRTVVYEDSLTVSVTGIVKDWDKNSDFGFKDLISYATLGQSFLKSYTGKWDQSGSNINVYVKLAPGTTAAQAEQQSSAFYRRRHTKLNPGVKIGMSLQPLADVHFNAAYNDTYGRRAHKPALFALAGIALFILVIAAINFINLSTAQSILRAKEVGIRKVMGSSIGGIVRQFLIETAIVVVGATLFALLLADPVIAALHGFIPEGVRLHITDPNTWLFIGITILFTSLIAGWYPGRALSAFLPVISLKGQGVQQLNSKSYLRKGLIVFQFTVSLLFIIGTMMVGRQIHYMLNTDLGFNKEAIVTIDIPRDQPRNNKEILANKLRNLAGVQQVSINSADPESINHYFFGTMLEYNGIKIQPGADVIDTGYIPLYGLQLVAGRNFYSSDEAKNAIPATATSPAQPFRRAFIINETAAKSLGFKNAADAVGKLLYSGIGDIHTPQPVVGVLKDFHSDDMHQAIRPFIFWMEAKEGQQMSIKLSSAGFTSDKVKTLMTNMESVFKKIYPGTAFQSRFFDESLEQLYKQEKQTSQILNIAMGMAVFISCMGLFGLATFTSNQRTREIGIRKVLGAGVPQLVSMLSKEFIILVGLSTVIAAPLAGWGAHQWLQNFAYRTSMPWWLFVMAGVSATVIALLTVSLRTIRAAMANPVKSLRVE
ncbi:MAG TPA: ABC transporter permease [Puia sp.]|nr:ABC transporter permease [Puia sp.]